MLIDANPQSLSELPQVVGVTSRTGLVMIQIDASHAQHVLTEIAHDAVVVHHVDVDPKRGLLLLLDPRESAGFLAKYPASTRAMNVTAVSVVGYQLQQNTKVAAQCLELVRSMGIEEVGLTCHPQSITVWYSGHSQLPVVRKLHEALIG